MQTRNLEHYQRIKSTATPQTRSYIPFGQSLELIFKNKNSRRLSGILSAIFGSGTDVIIATHNVVVVFVAATLFRKKLKDPSFQIGSGGNLAGLFFRSLI